MKRIGNFLFVEQWFNDHKPEQAIVNIDSIKCVVANKLSDCKQHTMIGMKMDNASMALTGDHADNIIELAKLLEKPTTVNQTFETISDINLTLGDEDELKNELPI